MAVKARAAGGNFSDSMAVVGERESVTQGLKVINFQSLARKYLEKERVRGREIFETHLRFSSVLQKWLQEPHKNIRKW